MNSDYEVRLTTLGALGGDTTQDYASVYDIDKAILATMGGDMTKEYNSIYDLHLAILAVTPTVEPTVEPTEEPTEEYAGLKITCVDENTSTLVNFCNWAWKDVGLLDMKYSFDNGETWTDFDQTADPEDASTYIEVEPGQTMCIKGNNPNGLNLYEDGDGSAVFFIKGGLCDLSGNIMSTIDNGACTTTTIPENPYCFACLFESATIRSAANLELPATTLYHGCYQGMFRTSSIVSAPELPASTLVDNCYYGMFYGCENLTSIKCLATDISATDCTSQWLDSVAASGTFTKTASMSDWTTGVNGIPSGWTVVDAAQ